MTAIVFPGQGCQFIGMSKDFFDNFEIARLTFEEIEDYVQIDLKSIIFDGKEDLINITKFTQLSIFTASLVIFKSLQNENTFIISHKGDILFDKFTNIIKFQKVHNFTEIAK